MTRGSLWRFLAVGLPTLGALITPLPTVDLAFQLRAGGEMLPARGIPSVDSWTFTVSNVPWLDQQWAAQVLLDLVYQAGGWTGLVILRAALVGLAFGLLLLVVRQRAPRLPAPVATLLVLAAFIVSAEALALRPQLFGIVLFAVTLWVLAIRRRHPAAVWSIPVIAAIWANLHGTFLLAPALCGLAWLADLFDAASSGARPWRAPPSISRPASSSGSYPPAHRWLGRWSVHEMLLVALVSTAATLVNPFGTRVWQYVATLTSDPSIAGRVSEWQPPSPLTAAGALVWLSVIAVAALAIVRVREGLSRQAAGGTADEASTSSAPQSPSAPHAPATADPPAAAHRRDTAHPRAGGRGTAFRSTASIPWPALLTLLVFGGFALFSGRGQAWWPFVAVFVVAPWIERLVMPAAVPRAEPRIDPPLLRRLNLAIATVLAIVGVAALPAWRPVGVAGVPAGTLTYAPQGIAWFLDLLTHPTPGCDSRIWNPQVWGSWLELEAPCARYAVDSRIELFPASIWDAAATVDAGAPGWDTILAAEGATIVITDRVTEPALEAQLGSSSAWSRVYADCDGTIWSRGSAKAPDNPPTDPSAGDALPGISVGPPKDCR